MTQLNLYTREPEVPVAAARKEAKLQKFTLKKKKQAHSELHQVMVEKGELGEGLTYLYDWLAEQIQEAESSGQG